MIFVNANIPPSRIAFVVSIKEVIKTAHKYLLKSYLNAFGGGVDGVCHEYDLHVTLPHMSTCPKFFCVNNGMQCTFSHTHTLSHTHTNSAKTHSLTNKYFSHTREMLSCLKQLNGSQDQCYISDS